MCVCLTSGETPESSENSDQYAKKSNETHRYNADVFTLRGNKVVKGMAKKGQTNNDKIYWFLSTLYLGRHKVLSYLHAAIKISHLKGEVG